MRKKKILITTTIQGHKSIAQAVYENLHNQYEAKIYLDEFKPFLTLYTIPYKYLPQINYVNNLGERQPFFSLLQQAFYKYSYVRLKKEVESFKPNLIISSYFGFNLSLNQIKKEKQIENFNLITDPVNPFSINFNPISKNFVFDEQLKQSAMNNKINKIKEKNLIVSGWFTRPKFYQSCKDNHLMQEFHFVKDKFTILICGGSEGSIAILKILPFLIYSFPHIQIIVVCGRNKALYRSITNLVFLSQKIPNHEIPKVKVLGFFENMPALIQMSDLIVGKAGPNLIFESIACQKPFMAISHIPGQEEGNLDMIKNYHLGFVEENPLKAIKLLKKIIKKPEILQEFNETIAKVRDYNQKAKSILLKEIVKILN
ncbi:hypothetical protein GYA19_05900 [Candidatus Beckwithbacteria bacterium]|nr:hypothetical protein [Candidatus Beckwithbacteria bacterium]